MISNNKIYVLNQNSFSQSFPLTTLKIQEQANSQPSSDDILLFNGSIIDKSEIIYRSFIEQQATYFTIISDGLDESSIDSFWHMNTIVLEASIANKILSDARIEYFLNVLATIENWTKKDVELNTIVNLEHYYEFNISKPINTIDYTPVNNSFLGSLASGFRGASEEKEVIYKIKYNSHDKKNMKAVITRFSIKQNEKSFSMVSVDNISNKEELNSFYESKQTEIDDFILSSVIKGSIIFNENEISLLNITKQIGDELYMVVSYKDNSAIALFEDDKLLKVDTIDNFALIRNYAKNDILPTSLENYKSFAENIKKLDFSKEFQNEFSKIINKSRNTFLIRILQNNSGISDEILQNFYYYLLEKKRIDIQNGFKNTSQLNSLLMVLETTDIENLHDKFLTNFFFYMRNSILKNNQEFLELFDEYKEQYKISISILEAIEQSLGMSNNLETNDTARVYDIEYLTNIKSSMIQNNCVEYIDELNRVLDGLSISEKDFDDITEESYEQINYLPKEYLSGETLVIDQTFSEDIARQLTYIHKFLTLPFLLHKELANKLDINLILDLLTMFSIQFKANEESTLTTTKSFIQKNYLTSSINSQKKEAWRLIVANVLYKLYMKHIEYDKYSQLVAKFDIEKFDSDLDNEFNLYDINEDSFLSKTHYGINDYISVKAAGDKFNKFFVNTNERYYIALIDRLFTSKDNAIIKYLLEMEDENRMLNSEQFLGLKQILCKGRFAQAKGADDVCIEFLHKIQNKKDNNL